jgi:hypothetical protein
MGDAILHAVVEILVLAGLMVRRVIDALVSILDIGCVVSSGLVILIARALIVANITVRYDITTTDCGAPRRRPLIIADRVGQCRCRHQHRGSAEDCHRQASRPDRQHRASIDEDLTTHVPLQFHDVSHPRFRVVLAIKTTAERL